MKVACVGDISVDWYPDQDRRFVGGISFNIAWHLRELGVDSEVFSAVGADPAGRAIKRVFTQRVLPHSHLTQVEGSTAVQRILLLPNGERKFDGYTPGVLPAYRLSGADIAVLLEADLIHVPLSDGLETLFATIVELPTRAKKAVDFSADYSGLTVLPEMMKKYAASFDIVFLGGSESDAELMSQLALGAPNSLFVLTLGSKGLRIFHGAKESGFDAPALGPVRDTTGCGDAFQAGFLAAYLQGRCVEEAVGLGFSRVALIATAIGATPCYLEGDLHE